MLPAAGELVGGKYRILRLIGEGAMGAVYEARHEVLGAPVALKFLHPDLAKNVNLVARFMQEARVSATVQSPHVVRVTDVDRTPGGFPYLVMDLLNGESLQQRLDRGGPLPRDEALDIALQILSGLEAAHGRGIVHRDLKPDNVFITGAQGAMVVKLLDFGIAKLREAAEYQEIVHTRPGAVMGTPEYMAPEQAISADQVDERADIFAFSVILYEMLTGRRPVEADEPSAIVEQWITGRAVPILQRDPSLPQDLAAWVESALSPDPLKRPSSVRELRLGIAPFAGVLSHAGHVAALSDSATSLSMLPSRISQEPPARPSGTIAKTLPPEGPGPPGIVAAPMTRGYVPQPARTPGLATTQPDKRGRSAWWVVLFLLIGSVAAAGAWLYENPSVLRDYRRPPLPATVSTIAALDPIPAPIESPLEGLESDKGEVRRSTRPSHPRSGGGTSSSPALPFPIVIPSQLPPLASVLPPGITIPGLPTAPPNTAPAPSAPAVEAPGQNGTQSQTPNPGE